MTIRLGLIARSDQGGLAALSLEFYRHLQPERTLVIDLGPRGRGHARLHRYPGAIVNKGMDDALSAETVRDFCRGLSIVYTAETTYRSDFVEIAHEVGCKVVVHAMPELWRSDHVPPDLVLAPTKWELDRLPTDTIVLPVPVARDRLPFRLREQVSAFVYQPAPAFHDRNGAQLVRTAQRKRRPLPPLHRRPMVENYWEGWIGDVLVMPRRYGGLSLPFQEAASLGIPVISLDLEPQRSWLPPEALIPARPFRDVPMVGGPFTVYDADPKVLADKMTELAQSPELVRKLSQASNEWAEAMSWAHWLPRYREILTSVGA